MGSKRSFAFAPFIFQPQQVLGLQDRGNRSTLAVVFPAGVSPEAMKSHLTVKDSKGGDAPFSVEAGTSPNICQVTVEAGVNWPVTMTLSKGMQDASKSLSMPADYVYNYPSETELQIVSLNWNEVRPHQYQAVVHFAQPVEAAELKPRVSLVNSTGAATPFLVKTEGKSLRPDGVCEFAGRGGCESHLKDSVGIAGRRAPGDELRLRDETDPRPWRTSGRQTKRSVRGF